MKYKLTALLLIILSVIIIGLPYCNRKGPESLFRVKYVESKYVEVMSLSTYYRPGDTITLTIICNRFNQTDYDIVILEKIKE